MNKFLKLALLSTAFFVLLGCTPQDSISISVETTTTTTENTGSDTTSTTTDTLVSSTETTSMILPQIELIGDVEMTIEQYQSFVDPGALVIGDFDLDITTNSNVDVSTPGQYTIEYIITYMGVTYHVFRTVTVTEPTTIEEIDFGILCTLQSASSNTLSFTLEMNDTNSVLSNPSAILLLGETEVQTLALNDGVNTLDFSDLLADTEYTLQLSGTYQVENVTFSLTSYHFTATTLAEETEPKFNVSFTISDSDYASVILSLSVDDPEDLLTNKLVSLYQGSTLIESKSYISGINTISFTNLTPSTDYTVELEGSYIYQDVSKSIGDYSINFTTSGSPEPTVTFVSSSQTANQVSVELSVVDDLSMITSTNVFLYLGDSLWNTKSFHTGTNTITFTYLEPETTYDIVIEYTYTPYDSSTPVTVRTDLVTLTTSVLLMPSLNGSTIEPDALAVTCTFDFDLTNFSNVTMFAQLFLDYDRIQSENLTDNNTLLTFSSLDSEETYTIKVYANYTVISTGEVYTNILIHQFDFTTLNNDLALPTIENILFFATEDSISVSFDVVDTDGSFVDGYIRLLLHLTEEDLIHFVVGHNTITFDSNIEDNADYELEFSVRYDIDGNPWTSVFQTTSVSTAPIIEFASFVEKDPVFAFDHMIMKLDLVNLDEYTIDSVMINYTSYDVFTFPSNPSTIYIDLGEYLSGTVPLVLNSITITLNGLDCTYMLNYETSVEVHAEGSFTPSDATIEVLDITKQFYNGTKFILIDETFDPSLISFDIHIDNPYGLLVTGIQMAGDVEMNTNFEIISPEVLRVYRNVYYGENLGHVQSIQFMVNDDEVTKTFNETTNFYFYGYLASELIHITNAAQFAAMVPTGHYVLDNDIDLTGYPLSPVGTYDNPFNGFFNGNGYTISNASMTLNVTSSSNYTYAGIFGYSEGFISDVTFENMTLVVNGSDIDSLVYAGLISGIQRISPLTNVHVTGNSTITVTGFSSAFIGGLSGEATAAYFRNTSASVSISFTPFNGVAQYGNNIGGLIGYDHYSDIYNSFAIGSIVVQNTLSQNTFVGGLLGSTNETDSVYHYVMNSYANVDIQTSGNSTGGLVGETIWSSGHNHGTYFINTYAAGSIVAEQGNVGGLIGFTTTFLVNSFSTTDITLTTGYLGSLIGNDTSVNPLYVDNVFRYSDQVLISHGSPTVGWDYDDENIITASNSEYNDSYFYTNILGWNEYYFDLSLLNIENGYYPNLK